MSYTAFMVQLADRLSKEKELTESSIGTYMRGLCSMNNKKPFANLSFLRDIEAVEEVLEKYADSTKVTLYTIATSCLELVKSKPGYKSAYLHYYKKMMESRGELKTEDAKNEKSEKQKAVWKDWKDIIEIREKLKKEVDVFINNKILTEKEYDQYQRYVVLCLYTMLPPRRNADYLFMCVVPVLTEAMSKEMNYYDLSTHKMIFNKFKTAKTASDAERVLDVPVELQEVLASYIKIHPLRKKKEFQLLVDVRGMPFPHMNQITRMLNKTFNAKIGSSHLRHFYVSSKYGKVLEEMKEDSAAMAHSLGTQKDYIKI
jgi:flagellar motor switch/type III secretory pathway protein FliN